MTDDESTSDDREQLVGFFTRVSTGMIDDDQRGPIPALAFEFTTSDGSRSFELGTPATDQFLREMEKSLRRVRKHLQRAESDPNKSNRRLIIEP